MHSQIQAKTVLRGTIFLSFQHYTSIGVCVFYGGD